jgi:hypothetical protein
MMCCLVAIDSSGVRWREEVREEETDKMRLK